MTFAEKLKIESINLGTNATQLVADAGFSRGAYSYWNKSNAAPDAIGIAKIAKLLGKTAEELMEDVDGIPMYRGNITAGGGVIIGNENKYSDAPLTLQEKEILETYRKLSARQQAKFLNFIFELEEQPQ